MMDGFLLYIVMEIIIYYRLKIRYQLYHCINTHTYIPNYLITAF